ncbi:unnamed protein product [Adineta steineri]|uniref:Uncharacterized protein n=1 Tax=Adineta steineri TaxID=433720 RepID=A0A820GN66_9BILA|nr:unnamed protein product [Adineta steineri]
MLTSFNQLQIPSPFLYPDQIVMNIVCQIVRQQNDQYWYDLIYAIQDKISYQPIPSAIITGLSCEKFSSHPVILEFQLLIVTWLNINQYEFTHWLDNI